MTTTPSTRPKVFDSIDEFSSAVGTELGVGDWLEIDQNRIDAFANTTEDWQWIHVDPERAERGPYGTTIAHGYLTLSLIPRLGGEIFQVSGTSMQVNYGLDSLRFPSPVRVGDRIRARAHLERIEDSPSGVRGTVRYTVEIEGSTKPALVASTVRLLVK